MKSFKFYWDQQLLREWDLHPERPLAKARFNILLSKVWPTHQSNLYRFRATGIYSYNMSFIVFFSSFLIECTQKAILNYNRNNNIDFFKGVQFYLPLDC